MCGTEEFFILESDVLRHATAKDALQPRTEILLDHVSTVVKMWLPSDINKLSTAASKTKIEETHFS
jgi:hypothetical protein